MNSSPIEKRNHVCVDSHHPTNTNTGEFFSRQRILDFGAGGDRRDKSKSRHDSPGGINLGSKQSQFEPSRNGFGAVTSFKFHENCGHVSFGSARCDFQNHTDVRIAHSLAEQTQHFYFTWSQLRVRQSSFADVLILPR